jgi:hypothetical protein
MVLRNVGVYHINIRRHNAEGEATWCSKTFVSTTLLYGVTTGEAASFPEKLVSYQNTTRRYSPENIDLKTSNLVGLWQTTAAVAYATARGVKLHFFSLLVCGDYFCTRVCTWYAVLGCCVVLFIASIYFKSVSLSSNLIRTRKNPYQLLSSLHGVATRKIKRWKSQDTKGKVVPALN